MRLRSALGSAIASIALATSALAAGDKVPKLDVAQSCREAQAIAGEDKDLTYKGCMHDERNAEAQLAQRWSKFKAVDRQNCLAQGVAPLPSYVEILTCLEMYDDANTLYRAGASVGVGVPPVEAPTTPVPLGGGVGSGGGVSNAR
jgi:hypothetical protein